MWRATVCSIANQRQGSTRFCRARILAQVAAFILVKALVGWKPNVAELYIKTNTGHEAKKPTESMTGAMRINIDSNQSTRIGMLLHKFARGAGNQMCSTILYDFSTLSCQCAIRLDLHHAYADC